MDGDVSALPARWHRICPMDVLGVPVPLLSMSRSVDNIADASSRGVNPRCLLLEALSEVFSVILPDDLRACAGLFRTWLTCPDPVQEVSAKEVDEKPGPNDRRT